MRIFLLLSALISVARADFALRDGDTVAFLGDSITAARGYSKIVEHYTMMRFPERKVHFVNAGKGGDTASGCLERLQHDVFDQGATVVTVAFGINDIGWGVNGDASHKQKYLDGIRTIIETCQRKNVRPIICSAAITSVNPDEAQNSFLQTMTDEGLALAKSMGVQTIDIQRTMREIQRRMIESNALEKDPEKRVRMHMKDGIHLEDIGQLAMAFAMLKGLGAPEFVSSATIDAKTSAVTAAGCSLTDVLKSEDGLSFTRLDAGLPVTFGPFSQLQYRWIPMPEINGYMLKIRNLTAGDYQIRVDGRILGKVSSGELERGIDLATMTANAWEPGGPWDAQSCVVKELVDARDKLWMGGVLAGRFDGRSNADFQKRIAVVDQEFYELERRAAKPQAHRFEITKHASP